MRSACSTSSARDNGHGGRWWTLRGRRTQRPPPAGTTEPPAEQEETRSPLTDSNRRPPTIGAAGDNRVHARPDTMKAIVQDRYGSPDVLELREIDRPVNGDDHVLVRVHAAGVDQGVWHEVAGLPFCSGSRASACARPRRRR